MVFQDTHSYTQLQFELAEAPGSKGQNADDEDREQKSALRRASSLRSALRHLAMEVEWAELGRTGGRHVRERGCQVLNYCRPVGHGVCDHNSFERTANILTSIPYIAVGIDTLRKRKTAEGRLYGASLIGVGCGSMTYHTSRNGWRDFGRKLDYWAISIASAALVRASRPGTPTAATALSLILTPFQPFAVVASNAAVVEVDFLRRAQRKPSLRPAHRRHVATSLLGGVAFVAEEFAPKAPLIHTAWHCLSAAGIAASGAFLEDIEQDAAPLLP